MFLEADNFDQDLSSWEEKYNIRPEYIYIYDINILPRCILWIAQNRFIKEF